MNVDSSHPRTASIDITHVSDLESKLQSAAGESSSDLKDAESLIINRGGGVYKATFNRDTLKFEVTRENKATNIFARFFNAIGHQFTHGLFRGHVGTRASRIASELNKINAENFDAEYHKLTQQRNELGQEREQILKDKGDTTDIDAKIEEIDRKLEAAVPPLNEHQRKLKAYHKHGFEPIILDEVPDSDRDLRETI